MNRSTEDLLRRLGIRFPLIQAPMAGVDTPELAAAVSNAGGLGSVALGADSVERARARIEATRALTPLPFNVNVFCHRPARADAAREAAWLRHLAPYFAEFGAAPPSGLREIYRSFRSDREMRELVLELRPAVVSFHFGLPPSGWLEAARSVGIVTLASATSPEEAREVEAAGIDAVVAQGAEAGGHRGVFEPEGRDDLLPARELVRALAASVSIPVVAAGGIMTGADLDAALRAGAAAVQMGTAFLLCPEAGTSPAHRAALQDARAYDTRFTSAISGRPARGIANRFYREVERWGAPPPPDYPIAYDAGKALHAAASARGSFDFAAHWAGTGAPRARALPAGRLVETLVAEWKAAQGASVG